MMLRILFISVLTLVFLSCIQDDKFGLSPNKDIKSFEIPGQAGATVIDNAERIISIPFSATADITALAPSMITVSNLAEVEPGVGDVRDFSDPVNYEVTAEDGSVAVWEVIIERQGDAPQLPNSDFDLWYDAGGYMQPGENENNTIWDTANKGLAIIGGFNTYPEDLGGGDFAAVMESQEAPIVVRMAAATLFTGEFTDGLPNPSDPRSNVDFGTPFTAKPSGFSVSYKYTPGPEYQDADGNDLPGTDQADIYVLLENRDGPEVARIGTGWFRSGTTVTDWTDIEVDIKYGELTPSDPEYDYANIRDGEVWGDAGDTPTHITVVFTSSALGDFFTGAIGSTLWVNDLELLY